MTDQVAERLAQRAALASGIGKDDELLELLAPSVEQTAENLQGKYTVPELKDKAEEHDIDLDGASLKADIATRIASRILSPDPGAQAETKAEAEIEVTSAIEAAEEEAPVPDEEPAGPESQFDMIEESRPLSGAGRYVKVWHRTRILTSYGQGNDHEYLDPTQAADKLSEPFDKGYDLLFVQHLGVEPRGHMLLWVFGLPNDPDDAKGHKEIWHVVRTIGGGEGAISGFYADDYITRFLVEGWELFDAVQLGVSANGINMLWVLVR